MSEKELKMFDVDAQLDAAFGKEGTPERKAAEDRANAFFTGQLIEEARKKANMTQAELQRSELISLIFPVLKQEERNQKFLLFTVSLPHWD